MAKRPRMSEQELLDILTKSDTQDLSGLCLSDEDTGSERRPMSPQPSTSTSITHETPRSVMSRYREWDLPCKVYVGNLGSSASKYEIESAFSKFGPLRDVWVARNPPGYAFVDFEDPRDAEDAVRVLNDMRLCGTRVRVEMSTGRSRRGGGWRGRSRSRSPRRRSYSRSRSRSPSLGRSRSLSWDRM